MLGQVLDGALTLAQCEGNIRDQTDVFQDGRVARDGLGLIGEGGKRIRNGQLSWLVFASDALLVRLGRLAAVERHTHEKGGAGEGRQTDDGFVIQVGKALRASARRACREREVGS